MEDNTIDPSAGAVAAPATGFNFEERLGLAAEKKERQKEQNRARQRAWKERHQPATLEKRWETALAALTEPERQALLALAERRTDLMRQITDVIGGIGHGCQAGLNMLFPDLVYVELRDFLIENPPVKSLAAKAILTDLDAKTLDRFDDRVLIEFGLETRIFEGFWNEFCRHGAQWCDANQNECDPAVHAELRLLVQRQDHTPIPAPCLPTFISESDRQGYIAAAESQRDHQAALAAEQIKWYARNAGQGTDNVPL